MRDPVSRGRASGRETATRIAAAVVMLVVGSCALARNRAVPAAQIGPVRSAAAGIGPVVRIGMERGDFVYDDPYSDLKKRLLVRINLDRAATGAPPLVYDAQASAIGDAHCRRGIAEGTWGHFELDGTAPYHRYAWAGGVDFNAENAARVWSGDSLSQESLWGFVLETYETMLEEEPPDDGHRRNILDPTHTHAGFGLAVSQHEFRFTHEFVKRYIEWITPLPRRAAPEDKPQFRARPLPGWQMRGLSVYFEPPLGAPSAAEINGRKSYGLPSSRREFYLRLGREREYESGGHGHIERFADGSFGMPLALDRGAGLYTIVAWVSRPGAGELIPASLQVVELPEQSSAPARDIPIPRGRR